MPCIRTLRIPYLAGARCICIPCLRHIWNMVRVDRLMAMPLNEITGVLAPRGTWWVSVWTCVSSLLTDIGPAIQLLVLVLKVVIPLCVLACFDIIRTGVLA